MYKLEKILGHFLVLVCMLIFSESLNSDKNQYYIQKEQIYQLAMQITVLCKGTKMFILLVF